MDNTNRTVAERIAINAEISRRILTHRIAGKTNREAFDLVLGAGAFDAMVSDLYDALRAKGLAEQAAQ